ncbi:MAG: serine/threonine protein kinase [Gemmataceae bacterium]|nr:serine/threonine protein kinase [Gemmataceae bacterium]
MSVSPIGKFQVLATLGSGAHSTILHIRRSADAKQYALKVVPIDGKDDQKYLEQARHEFRVAQMLDHPHLLKIYALETENDWLFRVRKAHLLLEYVNGKTLDTFQRLGIPQLVQIFVRVADGMVHLHRRGVWHADLKPNNILLSRTGEVKVIDYGLAWIKGKPKDRIQGTPEYMAPETATRSLVNERTDIYNLGATMYRLVTLRKPPSILTEDGALPLDAAMFDKLVKPVRECNPQAPKPLADLIHRCLSFDAHKRPERMSEIQGALDHLADDLVKTPEDRLEALEW